MYTLTFLWYYLINIEGLINWKSPMSYSGYNAGFY